jgi:hypothetical protein
MTFSRPIPEPLLIAKIEAGEIHRGDEICSSGKYWFSIQEVDEVRKFFGEIRLESTKTSSEEGTTSTEISPAEIEAEEMKIRRAAVPPQERQKKKTGPSASAASSANAFQGQPLPVSIEEEEVSNTTGRLVFLFLILFIFLATIYLIWVGAHSFLASP